MSPGNLPNRCKPPASVQRNASKFRVPSCPAGREKPTTVPRLLIAVGVFHVCPPRFGISVGTPFCQRTEWAALTPPTAMPQAPEMPTTWPRSLIAVAALVESPGIGGRFFIVSSFSQSTAQKCVGYRLSFAGRGLETLSSHPTDLTTVFSALAALFYPAVKIGYG